MREKTLDSKDIPLFETSFVGKGSTTILNDLSPQPSPSRESWRPLFRHAARKGSPLPMATTHMVPKETSEIGKNDVSLA